MPRHGQHCQGQRQPSCNNKSDLEALVFRLLCLGLGIIRVGRGTRFRNDGVVALLAHGVAQGLGTGLPGIVVHGGPGSAEVHTGRGNARRPTQGVLDASGATGAVHAQERQINTLTSFDRSLLGFSLGAIDQWKRVHD